MRDRLVPHRLERSVRAFLYARNVCVKMKMAAVDVTLILIRGRFPEDTFGDSAGRRSPRCQEVVVVAATLLIDW